MKEFKIRILRIKFKKWAFIISLLMCSVIYLEAFAFSQTEQSQVEAQKKSAPYVFIDCEMCDLDFIRIEMKFVNYVNERKEAQVYILITSQKTEAGEEYTLSFSGQKEFEGSNNILKYYAEKTRTADEVKKGLVNTLKMGLMRYVAKTPISSRISIDFLEKVKPTSVVDKWNFWVFSISADGFFSGDQIYKMREVFSSLSANRVTPNVKIRLSINAIFERDEYRYEDIVTKSSYDSQSFYGLIVKSLGEHWSIGGFFSASSSSYSNIKLSLNPAPAIEYDLFPYSQSTRKQLRFLYKLGFKPVRYREETIYDKKYENLWNESLSVTLELKRKWGTMSTTLEGAHYFHDRKKYHLELWTEMSLRIFKGLSFDIYGGGARIHDQLFLPKAGASKEDVLLRRRELETDYQYYFSVGLSYTFGSIYSKVVNPRFGGTSGGISIRM